MMRYLYFFPDFYAFPRFAGRRGFPFRLVRGPDGCHKSHAQDHARAGQTASSLLQSNELTIIHTTQCTIINCDWFILLQSYDH